MDAISTEKKLLELKRMAIKSKTELLKIWGDDTIEMVIACNDMIHMIDEFMTAHPVSDWQRKNAK